MTEQKWPDFNGGPIHNRALLAPTEAELARAMDRVVRERRVGCGRTAEAVDLCADSFDPLFRAVVEADAADGRRTRLRAERLAHYVAKAEALGADALLIVVRTGPLAAHGRRLLREVTQPAALEVVVCTQPQAIAWIRRRWPT